MANNYQGINDYPPIKQRFYMIFKSTGLTQSKFAKILGKSQGQISLILNGKSNISGDMIQLLRYKFNVNPDFILKGKRPMFLEKFSINRRIPIIADIPAGDWRFWYDSYAAGVGEDYIVATPDVKGENLIAVRVEGDSMEPKLHEGDILIINPHKEFHAGIAVVRHGEGFKIRNVRKVSSRRWYLMPQNPKYKDEDIFPNNNSKLYVPVKKISVSDI